jgi:hypothetical protein
MIWAPEAALKAWLAATVFWTAVPIGSVALLMMMRIIPGAWGGLLMVFAEAACLLLPLGAATFLPVLLGVGRLYVWVHEPPSGSFQATYLTVGFFALRTIVWFGAMTGLAWLLIARRSWSTPVSIGGLIVFALVGSLMAIDWLMSLDPRFHSSGFGLYVLAIQTMVALVVLIMASLLAGSRSIKTGVLGGLMLTVTLLWGYLAFMQYFILWSDNSVDAAVWYQRRGVGPWAMIVWVIALAQIIPLFLLVLTPVRASRAALLVLGVMLLVGKTFEMAWLVLPGEAGTSWIAPFIFLVAFCGQGLVFTAGFTWSVQHRIARRRPFSQEAPV